MELNVKQVTCSAPVNIAVIKYWGKRDEALILPINESLSGTLHQDQLMAKTTVMISPEFKEDKLWLNGKEESLSNPRIENVLKEIRRRTRKRKADHNGATTNLDWKVHICSENNFPTAAGLASSAAGYACLVYSLSQLYNVGGDVSEIARIGSGSACRSVYGGFVEWTMGDDTSPSVAKQVAPPEHWSEMRVLILVVSGKKKHTGSTSGMQTSVKTSKLLKFRAENTVPVRMNSIKEAIKNKDFQTFSELTMKDSNEMHACCLDTYPPISYMTDTSHDIQRLVHAINNFYGENKVCYTYDAGPNACLYLLEEDVSMVLGVVNHFFPPQSNGGEFIRGLAHTVDDPAMNLLNTIPIPKSEGAVQYIIHTKLGPGPQVLNESESLLTKEGLPKKRH